MVRDMRQTIPTVFIEARPSVINVIELSVLPAPDDTASQPARETDWRLPAVAYAAFFTEAERNEIGAFGDLPAHERVRWESVAAHIARTVVSPLDEDLTQWRAEQQARLAERVRESPYLRELGRAMGRTTTIRRGIETLRTLMEQSRSSAATARSHSRRLARSAWALDPALWRDIPLDGAAGPADGVPPSVSPVPVRPGGNALDGAGLERG